MRAAKAKPARMYRIGPLAFCAKVGFGTETEAKIRRKGLRPR
jgi:hypothetical protein